MFRGKSSRRGSTLIEFSLIGIPLILSSVAVVAVALDMWQFHTLAFGTQTTTRFIAMHGRDCAQNGSTCTLTLDDIETFFASHAIALDPSQAVLTLRSATAVATCNPLKSCAGNMTQFPSATDNGVNFDITLTATYPVTNPAAMMLPGTSRTGVSTYNLFAMSRQRITF